MTLTKRQASLIAALRSRHGRKDSGLCLCDGLRACSEVIALRPDLLDLIVIREDFQAEIKYPVDPVILPAQDFDKLTQTVNSQGIITVSRRPDPIAPDAPLSDPFVLVLDQVRDPGNFGTIIRTARAAGLHEIVLTKGSADPFHDKVIRSASGAQFALGMRYFENLESMAETLRKQGIKTFYRTLPAGGDNLFRATDVFKNSAIILGCESTGVSELEGAAGLNIPMPGTAESLNVAQAATIILFDYVRRITT
ncbi:MAG: RNA methyltransferase [Lentisphaeria bacterium]|nr:RNA methyltransferase [Lentisphaeria bacterium]MBO5802690.1 RNA methyltransferase [Lentisphaeria bacterium]MBR4885305.1 RNA methyltransferase [Lentisphaeria bacterium]